MLSLKTKEGGKKGRICDNCGEFKRSYTDWISVTRAPQYVYTYKLNALAQPWQEVHSDVGPREHDECNQEHTAALMRVK